MFIWLSDVAEEKGSEMINKLNKVYMFGIIDS